MKYSRHKLSHIHRFIILVIVLLMSVSMQAALAQVPYQQRVAQGERTVLYPRKDAQVVERQSVLMGTAISILILDTDKETADRAIDAALIEMRRIEELMTDWDASSHLEEINRKAGVSHVKVQPELFDLLVQSQKISELTSGAFDITYAGVGKLWRFDGVLPKLPKQEQIKNSLELVGYQKLLLDPQAKTAFLKKKGMRIGLGGIAKGYAVDRAVKTIRQMGIRNFAVNAGGDLIVKGLRDKKLWWVGIRDPRSDEDKNIAILPVSNAAVVTSGDSERYFDIDGKRYSHIIDPRTGYPAQKTRSVTVLGKKAYYADALATGLFVLGPEEAMPLVESLDDVEAMIIDSAGKIHVSSGLRGEKNSS